MQGGAARNERSPIGGIGQLGNCPNRGNLGIEEGPVSVKNKRVTSAPTCWAQPGLRDRTCGARERGQQRTRRQGAHARRARRRRSRIHRVCPVGKRCVVRVRRVMQRCVRACVEGSRRKGSRVIRAFSLPRRAHCARICWHGDAHICWHGDARTFWERDARVRWQRDADART